ncbi:arginine--tRNA ligase [Sphingobacterium corticis]|uniref:Arginine--tRNA ligase n=1 Tax=Sphingobacterium corticis TaxID=1812823 RepID=A0ABW5NI37_9SPHI
MADSSIQQILVAETVNAVKSLYSADIPDTQISLQETRKEFEGQFTIVVFPVTRFSKKSPEQTGQDIGEFLQNAIEDVVSFNVIKGFLNVVLSDDYWIKLLNNTISSEEFGVFPATSKRIMVEYSSPNTNKPLHLGHIRNNLLGFSVAEIWKAYGYDVVKANLINDRGIHICKSMLAWQKFGNGETPESSGLKGDHLVGKYYVEFDKAYKAEIETLKADGQTEEEAKRNAPLIQEAQQMLQKWEAGDEAVISLWKTMNEWVYAGFGVTYNSLGVSFNKFYYESDTYLLGKDIIQEGLDKNVFFKKEDGSVWIDLTSDGLDEKLVLRGDGTSVYITQDLGTAQLKFDEFGMEESIYVVGNEQDYHFKVLFLILKKLGKAWADGLFHLSYGMVDLPSGKMKSREGTVVDADDLMAEMVETAQTRTEELGKTEGFSDEEKQALYRTIGMGALKYFLLKVDPKKRLLFDPNESVDFQGHTGPFIQYTHARIKSILRKADYVDTNTTADIKNITVFERDLVQALGNYPNVIAVAAREFSPAHLANYAYELAKLYNKFYHEVSVLKADDAVEKAFRLKLSFATAKIIKHSMNLLGITVPEQM